MPLISPGVEVSVIDESQYVAAPTNSVPFIVIATAQNKSVPGTDTVAPGTLAGTGDNVYLMTSQRDLVNTFGNPFFYRTTSGTPIHGYELNEYGLLTAYSVLGVSNRAYVVRADVDLSELTASLSRPAGEPANGLYWLDLAESSWGIFEWNRSTGVFTNREPIVIESESQVDGFGIPLESIGTSGSYAVVTFNVKNPVYYKSANGEWLLVGSDDWKEAIPVVRSALTNPSFTSPASFDANGTSVLVSGTTVEDVADAVNLVAPAGVTASVVNGRLEFYLDPAVTSTLDLQEIASGVLLEELGIVPGTYNIAALQQSAHTQIPRWRSSDTTPRPTSSVWIKTTQVNNGANIALKRYNAFVGNFELVAARIYGSDAEANRHFDPAGGGQSIPVGTVYGQYDVNEDDTATLSLMTRVRTGVTSVTGLNPTPSFTAGNSITVYTSARGESDLLGPYTITIPGTTATDFVTAFNQAEIPETQAVVTATGTIELRHLQGGVIVVRNATGAPLGATGINLTTALSGVRDGADSSLIISNWIALDYTAASAAPGNKPATGTYWYYSAVDEVDIMINNDGGWRGYRTVTNDVRGHNLQATDPAGPIVSANPPVEQPTTNAPLALGDLWLDTSDLENYPNIYRWEEVDGEPQWVKLDNTDQVSQNGIVFADARWSSDGIADPINDPIPSITGLLLSNYVDADAPSYALYPEGTLLFNTRRSGYNVKRFVRKYFNPGVSTGSFDPALFWHGSFDTNIGLTEDAWVTVAGNRDDGSPYMGRHAVRAIIVAAMKSAVDTNAAIREEQRAYNLIAAPGYPELIPNMVALNNERKNTAFVVGDTPFRLDDSGNSILSWANDGGQDNLTSNDPYSAVFYPSCRTTDLSGNPVVQPPSHMMLRTIIRSDSIAFPWMAPAGTRRGIVDNAQSLGYIDAATGEFVEVSNRESVRDVLYTNRINPITFLPGAGITNYGNKTLFSGSALDRINVARLVAHVRGRLEEIGRGFLFEPNDPLTRNEIKGQVEQLMNELIAKRAIYDYLVVCDESNNTPARIDRNELWLDVAIEPVKAVEFIYIPLRIRNTGEIGA